MYVNLLLSTIMALKPSRADADCDQGDGEGTPVDCGPYYYVKKEGQDLEKISLNRIIVRPSKVVS